MWAKLSTSFKHMTGFEQFLFTGCVLAGIINILTLAVVFSVVGWHTDVVTLALVNFIFLGIGGFAQYHSGKKRFLSKGNSNGV